MTSVARTSEPYRAVVNEDWKAMERYFMKHNEALYFPLTVTKDNALHITVYSGNVELLEKFLSVDAMVELELHELQNEYGNTPLHVAAAEGSVKMASLLIDRDRKLLETVNRGGETPLFTAAAFGRTKMVEFLAPQVQDWREHRRRNDSVSVLHVAVIGQNFELRDENGMTCLQLLANMTSAFKSGYPMNILEELLYRCLPDDDHDTHNSSSRRQDPESGCDRSSPPVSVLPAIGRLWEKKKQHKVVKELATILAKNDVSWIDITNVGGNPETIYLIPNINVTKTGTDQQQSKTSEKISSHETPLVSAAKNGITEIVEVILKLYPQAVENVNAEGENIFHVAARYRRKEILDLLRHSDVPRSRLTRRLNRNGDSILHQAAYYSSKRQLRDRPGEALLMQSEIQWFKRVRKMVPPYFINHRNNNDQTADELFSGEHKDLINDGRKWIDQTTKACTIVAVLIATVAFTCAYTIPGGPNSKTGHPLLLNATSFRVFTISDTLSLCFSLTSVVVFLSIMTSRMDEQDFRRSLPLKLVLGLTTLFYSVASMMVAFSATLVLMMRQRLHWAAIPIYSIACYPVTIFLILQFSLYVNIAWFTASDLLHSFLESLPKRPRTI
ncbi:ankyrin repeat-containing protein ITN1-like [Corylus avellana]|uniref:ankyrin repeat-containing protein ITN1-like n=1 Tax=Corylus avellana TaxID=13451 RepID=UPI00286B82E9|nr:ankyrin repeat-containing protein ITN1-like [Corylus avellana]